MDKKGAFRRYVVATLYKRAVEEMCLAPYVAPLLSATTASFIQHGAPLVLESSTEQCTFQPIEDAKSPPLQKLIASGKRKGVFPILSSLKHLAQGYGSIGALNTGIQEVLSVKQDYGLGHISSCSREAE
jgi:hypothetical protein